MPIDPRRILFQDDHLLVVNKLSGELVVAAEGDGKLPLYDFLRKDYPGLKVVHRLDYQTSGIIVFAKTAQAVGIIRSTKFAGWKKTYVAIVYGKFERASGTIDKQLAARTHEGLVEAVTHYKVLAQFHDSAYVEARIDTGRKHQIRQHFAFLGHPLLRDPLYGNKKADERFAKRFGYSRFFLHAVELSFPHPITGKIIYIHAPVPPSFADALVKLNTAIIPITKEVAKSKRRLKPRTREKKKAALKKRTFEKKEWVSHGRRGRRR